ncbi:signal transduction histidine kinase [Idiomarina fontislapidosi]|uniref:Histidine kinase/HSP90-like ATPase domain-containing protein n=1 Tax=Idiomarina fontislapidosi TaxID=263723 RepID=A0A432Y882_9GAMM|nr:ATP-binding protein [Idiomarina fontislapidosi]PYE33792.1 signal transduction histidine kinase [Idiomarina fontislapidosi]RUO57188.1 hypothetical protein CWE25_05825 [Idiomarina fontislapidosi]
MIIIAIAIFGIGLTFWYSPKQLISRSTEGLAARCEMVVTEVAQLYPSGTEPHYQVNNPDLLQQVMYRETAKMQGVEGGYWHVANEFFGYAFPTYLGSSIKTDVPQSEMALLSSLSRQAVDESNVLTSVRQSVDSAVITVACPINTHRGLSAWLMKRTSLLPNTLVWLLFAIFGVKAVIGTLILVSNRNFEKNWLTEREKLTEELNDETAPVPTTTAINDVQPFLLLLYQARQKRYNAERAINSLEAKLGQINELSVVGRAALAFAEELRGRIEQLQRDVTAIVTDTSSHQFEKLQREIDAAEYLCQALAQIDVRHKNQGPVTELNMNRWTRSLADFHQQRHANDRQTIAAVCDGELSLVTNPLLLRFTLDILILHSLRFGPQEGEIFIRAAKNDGHMTLELVDENPTVKRSVEQNLFRFDDVRPEQYGDGLRLVKDLVSSLKGSIEFQSNGEISRFILKIPMTS